MKKILLFIASVLILSLTFPIQARAIYDPLSKPNNIFGIHILFPEEISEAANLVNSGGGDWGYVTIPIMGSDRNLVKWQAFMDNCRQHHLIPIIRLATNGDYFSQGSWSMPSNYDVLDYANFLNSLTWPTQNRYIIVFNEPNRGDEWGGVPNAHQYAQILDYAVKTFKAKNPNFFIISAGLDNAASNISGQSIDNYEFMSQMNQEIPGIFSEIDGISSHSYPNPAFSSPPSQSREGINTFFYEKNLADLLSGKKLPVFITETGWSSDRVSYDIQTNYYSNAFKNYWNDPEIVTVTPFIFNAEQGAFRQFSFIKDNQKTPIYQTYKNFGKTKGDPLLVKEYPLKSQSTQSFPIIKFESNYLINSIYNTINKSSKQFFKWLLKV